ncbi:MAG TPA: DedA family protein [Candidatus Merdisoma merdipullorum]|nr:DedA family protein [Candidatus Merdisoma merdipullorum]
MEQYGYPGILFLIALENIFPPIPSEVILTFGGFLTTYTSLGVPGVVLAATLGSLAGAAVLYGAGALLNKERLKKLAAGRAGKLLGLKPEDVEKADAWFQKKGRRAVFFCRCVPVVRSLISIPAGMSRMELPQFFLYTTAGSLIWNILLVSLGALMGESWRYIAYLAGEYSHVMLIVLGISLISGLIWLLGNRKIKNL